MPEAAEDSLTHTMLTVGSLEKWRGMDPLGALRAPVTRRPRCLATLLTGAFGAGQEGARVFLYMDVVADRLGRRVFL